MGTADDGAEIPQRSATMEVDAPHDRIHSPLVTHLETRLAMMHPAYFALVMATGIVAVACKRFGLVEIAAALAWGNFAAYLILWLMFVMRAVKFRERFVADLSDHGRAPGFFTVAAATGMLGSQAMIVQGLAAAALFLWWFCVALWAACTYVIFTLLAVRDNKPTLAAGINGGWLIAVVATQSVCVLGCALDGAVIGHRDAALFTLMSFWLGGAMLYLWIIGLIFYRYMFFSLSPHDLMPPYWINMGAVAISALAGALLAGCCASSPMLIHLRPFIIGMTVMFWATAAWWIPMLIALGFWRHRLRRVPLSYDPLYWGLVFPLGMYSACTFQLASVLEAPFLLWVARFFVVAAAIVWLLMFLGLAHRILHAIVLGVRGAQAKRVRGHPSLRSRGSDGRHG